MWDTLITLAIVAGASVFLVKRLFFAPHCGSSDDSQCQRCSPPTQKKIP